MPISSHTREHRETKLRPDSFFNAQIEQNENKMKNKQEKSRAAHHTCCSSFLSFSSMRLEKKYTYNLKQQQNVHLPDYTMEHYLIIITWTFYHHIINSSYFFFTKKSHPFVGNAKYTPYVHLEQNREQIRKVFLLYVWFYYVFLIVQANKIFCN